MIIMKTQQQILCLTIIMLLLLLAGNDVSATATTPPAAIPRDSMDGISASLRKGLRGFFVKSSSTTTADHDGWSSNLIPAATAEMDNKKLMIRGRSSSTNSNAVRSVNLDHQKEDGHGGGDGGGGDDHHHSSSEQHHDQKHSKDDKNKKQESSSGNNKGRKFKVCMTHNHCYKKKLVCPKKCGKKSSSSPTLSHRLLVPNHFPGHNNHCVLNCNKCIAHC